ncbi:MAG: glycosyltransferase [Bacteroidales bacterium]|nr:glycosyltransferase [Candidatus Liminaster caballi]
MKVAYILNDTILTNGANRSFLAMLEGLMPLGVEPIVIVPNRYEFCDLLEQRGITVRQIDFRPAVYPNGFDFVLDYLLFVPRLVARVLLNGKASRRLTAMLRPLHIDLIHTNVGVIDIGLKAAKSLGIPHVCHIREYADLDFGLHFYPNKARFHRLVARSYTVCITRLIQAHRGLDGLSTSRVIYNPIASRADVMPRHVSGDYFLYAGRILPGKGLRELIEAYASYVRASSQPLRLVVAGSAVGSKFVDELKAFCAARQLNGLVDFIGAVDDVPTLMQRAKATVVPSRNEGFGRVMPEAMFQGCPVIVRDVAGSHEQLENGLQIVGEPIAFAYSDDSQLSALLAEVSAMSDKQLEPVCQRAFDVVNRLYTTQGNVGQIINLYNEILKH